MSGVRLRLKTPPQGRLDFSNIQPQLLCGLSSEQISNLTFSLGKMGDFFDISMGGDDQSVILQDTTEKCDFIGNNLQSGHVLVEGHVGAYAAQHMKAGRLTVKGMAGDWFGAGMQGGIATIASSAGNFIGGVLAGEKFGMSGGIISVGSYVGERAGDRMRRGTIVVHGKTGKATGSRMVGGTIWVHGCLGGGPGPLMRRGTLIAGTVERLLPTFSDCGQHDMVFLRLMSRYVADTLGPLAPPALPLEVRRYAGDMAALGKGEILLTG
ncbi:MAG: formylmethanofuran dehydrogenase subunit C [Hyphomicrobium sp.]